MSTERRTLVGRQPLMLSLAVVFFTLTLFALLTAVLAQSHPALPVKAAGAAAGASCPCTDHGGQR